MIFAFENKQSKRKRKKKNNCVQLWHDDLTNTVILYLKYVWSYDELSLPFHSKKKKMTEKNSSVKKRKCSVCLCLVSIHAVILSQCMVVNYGGNVLS